MADPPPYPDTGDDRSATTGTPRWVKVFGIVALVLVVLVVVMLLFGGGPGAHGPGRHSGGDATPARDAPASADPARPEGHTGPPAGVEHGQQEP